MSYRASASRGSRRGGHSASAKHAYHTRQGDYLTGRDGVRDDLLATGCGNLPAFAQGDPEAYWLAADSFERANAALFVDLQFNLPAELLLVQQTEIVRTYCDRLFDDERLPYSWALHAGDGKNPNPHVHLMVSERMTDSIDRTAEQHFKRFNAQAPAKGGAQKTRALQPKAWLMEARAGWAEAVNRGLVAAGHSPRFDHRSKAERKAEALDLGNWRLAAELSTSLEQHEGPRVAGMRRRLERGQCALEDLLPYAQEIIRSNDAAREYNKLHLEMVAGMTDDELRLMLANDIAERARERLSCAARAELAEFEQQEQAEHLLALEALGAAQAQEHTAELADLVADERTGYLNALRALAYWQEVECGDELRELVAGEQLAHLDDLQAIEVAQAHETALIDNALYDAQAAELAEARAALAEAEQQAQVLHADLAAPEPECYRQAMQLQREVKAAEQAAQEWRAAHPIRASAADLAGVQLECDRRVARLREVFERSTVRAEALEWQQERRERRKRAAALEESLPVLRERVTVLEDALLMRAPLDTLRAGIGQALERLERLEARMTRSEARGFEKRRQALSARVWSVEGSEVLVRLYRAAQGLVEPAQAAAEAGDRARAGELLADALRDLKRAVGRLNNELTWASHDEQPELFAMRREAEAAQGEIEALLAGDTPPTPEVAHALRDDAALHRARAEGWRQAADAAKAERLQQEQGQSHQDDGPRPRSRGPRI